jgi:hypothetical protein
LFLPSSVWIQHSQLAVNVKGLICADFEAADALGAHLCIVDGRVEFVAPGAAVAVAIAVVVAEQVIAAGLFAAADFERLVYGCEEFFFVFGDQAADG